MTWSSKPKEVLPCIHDVYDHTLRIAEIIVVNRDIIAGMLGAHLAQVSNSLDISMRVLTVMATFLMTASLVAGIYGMNFKHMPELEQRWGYPFSIALMGVLVFSSGSISSGKAGFRIRCLERHGLSCTRSVTVKAALLPPPFRAPFRLASKPMLA